MQHCHIAELDNLHRINPPKKNQKRSFQGWLPAPYGRCLASEILPEVCGGGWWRTSPEEKEVKKRKKKKQKAEPEEGRVEEEEKIHRRKIVGIGRRRSRNRRRPESVDRMVAPCASLASLASRRVTHQ